MARGCNEKRLVSVSTLRPCTLVSKNLPQPGRFDFLFESGGAAKGETGRMEDLEDLRFLKRGLEDL